MRIASFNIKSAVRALPWKHVVHDLEIAKRSDAVVLCWQELTKRRRHRRALRAVFPTSEGWRHFHATRKVRTSVTVNTNELEVRHVVEHRLTKASALAGQPARYANEVVVRPRVLDRVDSCVFSVHLTNGGYNGRDRANWIERRRRKLWDQQWAGLVELVADRHEKGYDVELSGDFNRRRLPRLHPSAHVVLEQDIDKVIVVPAPGAKLEARRRTVVEDSALYTDHPGLAVTVVRSLPGA